MKLFQMKSESFAWLISEMGFNVGVMQQFIDALKSNRDRLDRKNCKFSVDVLSKKYYRFFDFDIWPLVQLDISALHHIL